MTRSKTSKRKIRALHDLQGKGILAVALGTGFLLMPLFLGSSPMLKPLAVGLRTPGWITVLLGAVLLGLHYVLKRKVEGAEGLPKAARIKSTPMPQQDGRVVTKKGRAHASARATKTLDVEFRREPVLSHDISAENTTSQTTVAPPQPSTQWSPAVFPAIEWRRFEAVCEALFGQAGFETRSQTQGADGGVDIWLYSRHAEGPAAIVQCKHWQGTPVGVKEVREFFGVMASHKLQRGTYATTSVFTADAQQFAKANGINAMDGAALLRLIATRTPEQQQTLLAVAFEGDYWRPTCASCGIKLVERAPAKGGAAFWGCNNYPRCKSRLPMVAALR